MVAGRLAIGGRSMRAWRRAALEVVHYGAKDRRARFSEGLEVVQKRGQEFDFSPSIQHETSSFCVFRTDGELSFWGRKA